MADPKKESKAQGVVLAHDDAPASFTHADGTTYSTDKAGQVEVDGAHVEDAKSHGFKVPAKKEQAK